MSAWAVYRTELRRSPLRWAFPLLLAVDLAVVFGRERDWVGNWPQTSAAAQVPLFLLAPLLAGATAWAVVRARRGGVAELRYASARRGWQQEAAQFAAHLSYGLAAYGAGALAAAAVSVREAGPGFLWPGYVLLGVSVVVASVAVGQLTGRWCESAYVVPVLCALGWYLVMVWLGSEHGYGFTHVDGPPQLTLVPEAVAARVALALALAALAVLAPPLPRRGERRWRRPSRLRVVALAPVVGVALCAAAVPATGDTRTARTPPERPLCSPGTPRVCVWPEDRKHLPQLDAMAKRLGAIPHDWIVVPDTFYERGLRERPTYGPADFKPRRGQLDHAVRQMAAQTYRHSYAVDCPTPRDGAGGPATDRASVELRLWLQLRALGPDAHDVGVRTDDVPPAAVRAVQRLVHRSEAVQLAWVHEKLATHRAATGCALRDLT